MKRKFVKSLTAVLLATTLCVSGLAETGMQMEVLEVQAEENATETVLKSWDFTNDIAGWYYGGTSWEYQYTGVGSSVEASQGMLKANVDYSAEGAVGWSQIGVCYWDNAGMNLVGANKMTFDFIYDSAIMTGGFNAKIYSSAGIDTYVAVDMENAVACSELGGTWKKATTTISFDPISALSINDWSIALIGSNTSYKGAIYLDNISIIGATSAEEDIYVDATKVATTTPEVLSVVNNKLNAYKTTGELQSTDIASAITLVDGNADENTKVLYAYLKAVGDSDSVIFGHQNDTWHKAGISGLSNSDTKDVTGSISGVVGIDTLSLVGNEYSAARYNSEIGDQTFPETAEGNVAAAAALTNKNIEDGAIITLSSHMPNFSIVEENDDYDEAVDPSYAKYNFSGYSPNTLTGDVMNEMLPGGEYNAKFNAYLDMIAEYSSQVNGTVLFRPFHENTGSWFWWGAAFCDAQTYKNVYKYTVQYLRDEKNIHNILYVYGPSSEAANIDEYGERYPGDDYVDILGFDMYHSSPADADTWFDSFKQELSVVEAFATAHNKLITVTETGVANSVAKGDNQTALLKTGNQHLDWYNEMLEAVSSSKASYFLLWANFGEKDGFYTPYVKEVKENGTLHGQEELDYFVDFYNDARSIFAINQKAALSSLKQNMTVTATATTTSATGFITTPVSGVRILKPTTITAKMKGLGVGENVSFALVANGNQIDIPASLSEAGTYTANITTENLAAIGAYVGSIELYVDLKKIDSIGATFNIAATEEDPYEIDGFEGYSGVNSLMTKEWATNKASGSTIALSLTNDAGKFCSGNYGLKFSYNEKSDGWAGATISKQVNWSDCNALQFWTIPDGNKQKIVIQLTANGKVYEAYLNNYTEYTDSTKPILVTIPFSEFVQRDTEGHPAGGLVNDCSSVTSFGLWVNAIAGSDAIDEDTDMVAGTIYYDKITAIHTDIATPNFGNVTVGEIAADNTTAYLIAQVNGNYYYEILPAQAEAPADGASVEAAVGAVTAGSGEELINETKVIYMSNLAPDTEYALYVTEKATSNGTYSAVQKVVFQTKKNAQSEIVITGVPSENITYGSVFSIGITGGSIDNSAITYDVTEGSNYASVDQDGKVHINGVGEITIRAVKAGNESYEAVSTTTTFKSLKAEQDAITLSGLPTKVFQGEKFTLAKTGGSGTGSVTYKVLSGGEYVTVNATTGEVEVTGIGEVKIQVTKASDKNYKKATANVEFTCNKMNQSELSLTAVAYEKAVKLSWPKTSDSVNYVVYRSNQAGARGTEIASISKGTTLTYMDDTVVDNEKYYYSVGVFDQNHILQGYSNYSNIATKFADTSTSVVVVNKDEVAGTFDVLIHAGTAIESDSTVKVDVWNQGVNDLVGYETIPISNGAYYLTGIDIAKHGFQYGTYKIQVSVKKKGVSTPLLVTSTNMKLPTPTLEVTSANGGTSYNIIATNVAMQKGLKSVMFAVWSEENGKDDIQYYTGKKTATGTYSASVVVSKHKSAGTYQVLMAETSNKGETSWVKQTTFQVEGPKKGSVSAVNLNQAEGTFDLMINPGTSSSNIQSVKVGVWNKGMSDLKFYDAFGPINGVYLTQVNIANHKYAYGTYQMHVYTTDANGITALVGTNSVTLNEPTPIIIPSFVPGKKQISIAAFNVGVDSGVANVCYAVWTEKNGRDDLHFYNAGKVTNALWGASVPIANHNEESGKYNIAMGVTTKAGLTRWVAQSTYTK